MTNASIIDSIENGTEIQCNRYNAVQELLSGSTAFSEKKAFEILEDVKQNSDQWITEFSMVFDKNKEVAYYCQNQNFNDVEEYNFNR